MMQPTINHSTPIGRTRRRRRRSGGAVLVSALFALTACGSDDDSSADDSTTSSVSSTTVPTTAPPSESTEPAETTETADTTDTTETTDPTADTDATDTTTAVTEAAPDTTLPAVLADACTADKPTSNLTVATAGDRKGFDPAQVTGGATITGGVEMTAIYDTLMRWNPEVGKFEPHLAESLESDGATTWTLKLRPDVTFGNGDPLNAAAVKASIERLRESNVSAAGTLKLVDSIDVVDDLTVSFKLNGPWGDFPYFLASPGGMIVNTALVDQLGPEAFNTTPVGAGAGPFELTDFASGEDMVMTAKDDYWGGPLCIDTLTVVKIDDDRAAYESLQLGEIGVRSFGAADVLADLRADGYEGIGSGGQGIQLMLNTRPEHPTGDIRVRQAIAHAIDVDLINERANQGLGLATTSIVDPNSPLYTEGSSGLAYDPDLAAELVAEAKADGWDGSVRFLCANENPDQPITIQAQLEAVGITVQAEFVPVIDSVGKVLGLDFDVACWSLNVLSESAWAGLDRAVRSDSPSNRSGIVSPEMDAALVALREAGDNAEKKDALFGIQEIWNETVPGIVLSRNEEWVTWAPEVHGVKVTREGVFMLDDAWVEG